MVSVLLNKALQHVLYASCWNKNRHAFIWPCWNCTNISLYFCCSWFAARSAGMYTNKVLTRRLIIRLSLNAARFVVHLCRRHLTCSKNYKQMKLNLNFTVFKVRTACFYSVLQPKKEKFKFEFELNEHKNEFKLFTKSNRKYQPISQNSQNYLNKQCLKQNCCVFQHSLTFYIHQNYSLL